MQRSRTESVFRTTWVNERAASPHMLPSLPAHSEAFLQRHDWKILKLLTCASYRWAACSVSVSLRWDSLALPLFQLYNCWRLLWQGRSYGSSAICMRTRMGKISKERKFWAQLKIMGTVISSLLWSLWSLHRTKASTLPGRVHSNLTVRAPLYFPKAKMLVTVLSCFWFNYRSLKSCLLRF